jgi:hypothetical protein
MTSSEIDPFINHCNVHGPFPYSLSEEQLRRHFQPPALDHSSVQLVRTSDCLSSRMFVTVVIRGSDWGFHRSRPHLSLHRLQRALARWCPLLYRKGPRRAPPTLSMLCWPSSFVTVNARRRLPRLSVRTQLTTREPCSDYSWGTEKRSNCWVEGSSRSQWLDIHHFFDVENNSCPRRSVRRRIKAHH